MNNIMRKEVKNECPYSNENSSLNQYFSRLVGTVICGTSISITVTVGLERPNSNDGHQSENSSGSNKGTDREFCHSNSKQ